MKNTSHERIGIIGELLAPPFNEAYANQMHILSRELSTPVLTCDDIGYTLFRRAGRYLIVNIKFLLKSTPFFSFLNGLLLYAIVKVWEKKFDVIILAAGVESEFLNYLDLTKCIPIVNSTFRVEKERMKSFVEKIAPKLKRIIVQSERVKRQLIESGVEPQKIHLIYPIVDQNEFRYSEPPSLNEFRILFASAPNVENPNENNFEAKGVPLLLEAFGEFIKEEDAILYIVWRGKYNKELYQMINRLDLKDHVKVIDEVVDMPETYAKVHITVIPFLNLWRSPEIPLSAVESLACGRPVVATAVGEIAELIQRYKCGCVAKPVKDDFLMALIDCKRNYLSYQANCLKTTTKYLRLQLTKFWK